MDVYDTTAHSVTDDGISNCEEVITRIVTDLFSYDDIKRRRIFDHYYFSHATFTSPILRTEGVHNIKHVLLVWKTLNKEQPQINDICFNGKTCVVFLTQILCPRMFPWIKVALPVTVILEFKETDKDSGLLKIDTHSEHWTIEGILKAIPFVSFWYDHVVRTMIGKLLSATGEAVYTATETASLLVQRNKEIEEAKRKLESGEYAITDEHDQKQEQVMMLRIKNSSFSSTAS
ncbi:hypothetical protein INT46_002649 [Mucor plumbeus]|uniref:SigF-like NTF2-like domain-containing protein n=1 Tax=Mucor plumbeus TaxID=97098 RepID=A0A8H7QM82_9FUNG|nr:hypothetical protein INT46_002649 [Mucor plumbeus]